MKEGQYVAVQHPIIMGGTWGRLTHEHSRHKLARFAFVGAWKIKKLKS